MSLAIIAITFPKKLAIQITPQLQTPKPAPVLTIQAKQEPGKIIVYIKPIDTPVRLSAFAVRGEIKTTINTKEVIANEDLTKNGWIYPFSKVTSKDNNTLLIEASAFHIGKEIFTVNKEVPLITIPTPDEDASSNIALQIDEEVTRFLAEDAITQIPILVK